MASRDVTLRYDPVGGATTEVTVRAPQFGNKDADEPSQSVVRTRGGVTYSYDMGGPAVRRLELSWDGLTDEERSDLQDFLSPDGVDRSAHWFYLTLADPTWREVVCCDGLVGGVAVACEDYACGQRVRPDSVTLAVRLVTPPLSWDEPGPVDGLFSVTMTLEVISGFLPDNG